MVRMRKTVFRGLLFFFCLLSCRVHAQSKFRVFESKKIEISAPKSIGSKPYFSSYQSYKGKSYLWLVDKESNSVFAYSPKSFKSERQWCFENLDIGSIRTFQIVSPDSVLLYTKNTAFQKQLFWYNPKKGMAKQIVVDQELVLPNPKEDSLIKLWETVYSPSSAPIQVFHGKILFGILPYLPLDKTPDIKKRLFVLQEVGSQSYEWLPFSHPDSYRFNPVNMDHATAYLARKGDSLLFTLGGSPELWIWNSQNEELDSLQLAVPGTNLSRPPVIDSLLSPMQQLLSNGYYGRLFFHSSLKIFLRVVYLPTPLMDAQSGRFNTMTDRKACLFVWNDQLQPLGFQMLPPGVDDRNAFCTPQGFMILSPNESESNSKSVKLQYYSYEFDF